MVRDPAVERDFWEQVDPIADYERCIFDGPDDHGLNQVLEAMPDRGVVFDLGCGPGRLANQVADLKFPRLVVEGFDISAKMIRVAQNQAPSGVAWFGARFGVCDGRTIPASDAAYGGGYSVLLFQHLDADAVKGYLREAARVLKPGAPFLFQIEYTPDGGEGPYAHNHSPQSLAEWCDTAGLNGIEAESDRVYPSWLWFTARQP